MSFDRRLLHQEIHINVTYINITDPFFKQDSDRSQTSISKEGHTYLQEDAPFALKEMCRRSTLCLWIAIAVLVQQSTFVCAQNCNCLCNRKMICQEIVSLRNDVHSNTYLLEKLMPTVLDSERLWKEFKYEDWKEKIASCEKKMESFEDLKERLDKAESRADRLETDLYNSRKDFEKKMAEFERKWQEVQSQAKTLETKVNETEEKIATTQEQLLETVSIKHSETESQLEELKNNLHSQLLLIKNETIDLKFDIENEKEFRTEFQKELLHNTSNRFSEVHKQYEELKDDFDTMLLNGENYTKLWKSDIVEGKSAWNISEDDAETLSNMVSTLRMNDRVFQMAISDVKKRLLVVESEIENFKPAIEAEKQAREELEEKLQGNFSTSAAALQYSEVRKNFSSVEDGLRNLDQRLSLGTLDIYHFKEEVRDIYRRMSELESSFRNVQNDIVELDIKVSQITDKPESHSGRDGLRSRRELERRLTEVRKYRSTAENKATPPETVIPME